MSPKSLLVVSLTFGCAVTWPACSAGSRNSPAASGGAGGSNASTLELGPMLGAPSDPTTCEAAAATKSYLGCDFWPTVTANGVWSIFDFAVVVANVGAEPANVTVDGAGGFTFTTTVAPRDIAKIPLPWVDSLKGPDSDTCGKNKALVSSVMAKGAAYHLTSTRPIIAYQFNALEYQGSGGRPGKDWTTCPGLQLCATSQEAVGCFSFTNDASILLPTSALSGNYRVPSLDDKDARAQIAITDTQPGTTVDLNLASTASLLPGGPVASGDAGNGPLRFQMDVGDVVELISDGTGDLGGSLVKADKPVQVLVGSRCASIADDTVTSPTCDHLEESVPPAETLGSHYVVAAPTGPLGSPNPYRVRLFGNVDGTTLTYLGGAPPNAPSTLSAGQVVDLGILATDFEVSGNHEFAVSTFLVSSELANPEDFLQHGDPSQSQVVAVEQYRKSYVFLAPDDYDVSFVDITMPLAAKVTLDGAPLPSTATPIGTSGLGLARVRLGGGKAGAHSLTSDIAVGLQVIGYGSYTSYQYPAGMDLSFIAPPPL